MCVTYVLLRPEWHMKHVYLLLCGKYIRVATSIDAVVVATLYIWSSGQFRQALRQFSNHKVTSGSFVLFLASENFWLWGQKRPCYKVILMQHQQLDWNECFVITYLECIHCYSSLQSSSLEFKLSFLVEMAVLNLYCLLHTGPSFLKI